MKLDARRIPAFLADPGAARGVLLYGPDTGLVRERAEGLVRLAAGSLDDPFRVSEPRREQAASDPGLLAGEMAALSLMGGRRAVRLREATDSLAPAIEAALAVPGDTLLVVEAGELPARSKLRALFERAANAAAVPCYADTGAALRQVIAQTLGESGVTADADAVAWLADNLGADRGLTRSELAKLALYAGEGGRVTVADARLSVGDHAGLGLDDALFAATAGDVAGADRALALAFEEGANPVQIVRAALRHMQRLHLGVAEGLGALAPKEAAQRSRPPVFFRHEGAWHRALQGWTEQRAATACERLLSAELACKTTGAPDVLIASRAVLDIARAARSSQR
ncbi:DNA polymerase III subunit delta [Elioraea rosea]|uniref:DNA polymerase III subunit delta n=1 Tax=Elioraea rosea TaxID=2492390 RepID=UPI001184D6EC|nr:DNA polymerase III subunit delta [Elioraea rosea]